MLVKFDARFIVQHFHYILVIMKMLGSFTNKGNAQSYKKEENLSQT